MIWFYDKKKKNHSSTDCDDNRFQATDRDTGEHVKVQYSLRGDDSEDFVVNSDTGTIYVVRLAENDNVSKTFEVVAKDNDGKFDESESVLTVTVS